MFFQLGSFISYVLVFSFVKSAFPRQTKRKKVVYFSILRCSLVLFFYNSRAYTYFITYTFVQPLSTLRFFSFFVKLK